MRSVYTILVMSLLVLVLAACSREVPTNEAAAIEYVQAQGYAIQSSMHEVTSYMLEKSKLVQKPDSTPLQQIWGVQKTAPDAYFDKEISIYGFTVSGHPLEKLYKARTKVYIMISRGQVIGGYSFPDIEGLKGAVYSLNGKTQEEITGLSYEEWSDNWQKKYGQLESVPAPDTVEGEQAEGIPLAFQPIPDVQRIKEVSGLGDHKVLRELELITVGKIILYIKPEDEDYLYGAYEANDGLYELGVVGGRYSPMDELDSVMELALFDKSLVRIKGVFGANAPVQNYFSIEDGRILPVIRIDTGHATEIDLDEDGLAEIVSAHGTPMTTYIYRWEGNRFFVSSVNEALGAASVQLSEEKRFEAELMNGHSVQRLSYQAGKMQYVVE